ncbi:MAG TPA: DUF4349 domain-containing protein [Candidatus Paceibacterota bacterium]|nr:DUF4349 domain-containing protein [Candidatus Paceibacterota bacterium]
MHTMTLPLGLSQDVRMPSRQTLIAGAVALALLVGFMSLTGDSGSRGSYRGESSFDAVLGIISSLLPLLLLLAGAAFVYGVGLLVFALRQKDEAKSARGRRFAGFGAIGFGALVLLWGITGYFQASLGSSFGLAGTVTSSPPSVGMAIPSVYQYAAYDSAMPMPEESYGYGGPSDKSAGRNMLIAPVPPPTPGGESAPATKAMLIKTANLTLLVGDADVAYAGIAQVKTKYGGELGNASFHEYQSGKRAGTVTVWVPSQYFEAAITEIKTLALRVEQESVNAQDVSAQFVDLESNLRNSRAAEEQYLEIMKRSGTVTEILAVAQALKSIRQEIEMTQGRMNHLSRQVAMSAITITLTPEPSVVEVTDEWRPMTVFKGAVKDLAKQLTNMVDDAIRFLVALPLLAIRLGFFVAIVWFFWVIGKRIAGKFAASTPMIPPAAKP